MISRIPQNVHKSEAGDDTLITEFFNNLNMPSLDQGSINTFEKTSTQAEIERAFKTSKSGKLPGPDGYPIEFYKAFSVLLVPLPCEVYEEVLQRKTLPLMMTQATNLFFSKRVKTL